MRGASNEIFSEPALVVVSRVAFGDLTLRSGEISTSMEPALVTSDKLSPRMKDPLIEPARVWTAV